MELRPRTPVRLGPLAALLFPLIILGGTLLPAASVGALAAPPLDFDVPGGHFYTEANGQPLGTVTVGFRLGDEGGMGFWTGYSKLGGVTLLGYPISGRFQQDGFVEQATQRGVLQWRPESASVVLTNVFDQLHDAGKDDWLKGTYQVPVPVQQDERGLPFAAVVQRRQAWLDANASIKAAYFAAADPIQLYGLPTSGPVDFGPMVVVRCQRVAFQLWKVAVPWAKAGEVTLVNGGDVAKAAGLLPAAATVPEPAPIVEGQAAKLPWSGWWWPVSTTPYNPPYLSQPGGPLAKYDAYVVAGGGTSPGTADWERTHMTYSDNDLYWAGHCNGWAASTLVEPEPTGPVTARGITFTVADQKGLLADYHFADSPLWEYGSLAEALKPQDFHRMVLTWLGQQHKGFVIDDYATAAQIESYPVYRFHMIYLPDPQDPNKQHVQLTLWMADYHVPANFVGLQDQPSPDGQRFDYFIYGPKDNPTGGDWEGVSLQGIHGHPRFIWYPDPSTRNFGTTLTAPSLDYATILAIQGRPQPKPTSFGPLRAHGPASVGSREVPWLGH